MGKTGVFAGDANKSSTPYARSGFMSALAGRRPSATGLRCGLVLSSPLAMPRILERRDCDPRSASTPLLDIFDFRGRRSLVACYAYSGSAVTSGALWEPEPEPWCTGSTT